MLKEESERELVRVPARRLPLEEKKAAEIETDLPAGPQDAWQMPMRWRVY